jgi:hypothetical protein
MSSTFRRTWEFVGVNSLSRKIWDRGDELWEMGKQENGINIRHFRVISRKFLEEPKKLEEVLEVMEDSPIPLDTLERVCIGWKVSEDIISSPPPLYRQKQAQDLPQQQVEAHEQQGVFPRQPRRKREDLRLEANQSDTALFEKQPENRASTRETICLTKGGGHRIVGK